MMVFKYKDETNFIEINRCDNGLYVSIQSNDGDEMTWQNIVIPASEIPDLIKLIQDGFEPAKNG